VVKRRRNFDVAHYTLDRTRAEQTADQFHAASEIVRHIIGRYWDRLAAGQPGFPP
jgi:hypothetical protein